MIGTVLPLIIAIILIIAAYRYLSERHAFPTKGGG